jgi:DNA repair protein RadD
VSPTGTTAARLIELRPYQVESIEAVRAAIRAGKRRIILTIPTGGGKTYTAVSIIASAVSKDKRCLFVAHRLELIDQCVRSIFKVGLTCVGVIRAGDKRADLSQPIQVASIATLARRKQDDFDVVIIDEGHRAASKSYVTHLFERHPRAIFIILTATPCRSDNKPLNAIADDLIVGALYSELLASGAIVEPRVYSTPMLPDMSTVRTKDGDFNRDDLEAAMNRGALIGDLYEQWAKHPRQRTVAFAVSVAHSRAIVEMFRSKGVKAEHLDGETKEEERKAILERLESGETELVSNVGVLCEGWDLPACKTLILARPTKSLALYMQMAGRILRPWNDVAPVILDHGGNVDRHGLPHEDREWSLDAKPKRTREAAASVKMCKCFVYVMANVRKCPHCGHDFVATSTDPSAKDPVVVDLELRTLAKDNDDERMKTFRALVAKARRMGWKFGAAIIRFRELHKVDPPQPWIDALKKDYRKDAEWKARVKERADRIAMADQGEAA